MSTPEHHTRKEQSSDLPAYHQASRFPGDPRAHDLHRRLTDSLSMGELVAVPDELLIALNKHRKEQPTVNGWAEQHNVRRRIL